MNAIVRDGAVRLDDDFQKVIDELVKKDMVVREERGSDPYLFVMSDASVDRYGDIIDQSGWVLSNFRKNPIALFGHSSQLPIGTWSEVKVVDGKLQGRLNLLPAGLVPRVDELRAFIEAGVLRAVSVGFRPLKSEPIDAEKPWGAQKYLKSELVECSLVSIPANANALAVAKSLNLSRDAQSLIFGESAEGKERRTSAGEPADPPKISKSKGRQMTIAQKIQDAEANALALKDQIAELAAGDMTAEVLNELKGLKADLVTANDVVSTLRGIEADIADRAEPVAPAAPVVRGTVDVGSGRVFAAAAAPKAKGMDLLVRGLACQVQGHIQRRNAADVMAERYGENDRETRGIVDFLTTKAASAVATTTTSGWASQLVNTVVGDFLDQLQPLSIYPRLAAAGPRFTFGQNGVISIPSRSSTPTIAGSFVAEGAPIPVRQGGFSSVSITPRKMAVISALTREIAEHSTPSIEAIIREAILDDTAVAIDTVLMDATASSTTRPAGLRNGVSGKTATSGANLAAFITDMKALLGDLVTANSLRKPMWIMNPVNALSATLLQNAGGDFPFANDIRGGTLFGYPIIQSNTVTLGTVMLIDAADFFSATTDVPQFDVSDTATLHMEDTSPTAIGTAGTPNVVAAPVRSLFQTDSIAIRMRIGINWAMRRSGVIAYVTSVTW
jgi:HK97 family phage major capsid protein/HK97 family phage prohead protease